MSSTEPVWEYGVAVLLEPDLLLDPRRHLILKAWHQAAAEGPKDREADQVIQNIYYSCSVVVNFRLCCYEICAL